VSCESGHSFAQALGYRWLSSRESPNVTLNLGYGWRTPSISTSPQLNIVIVTKLLGNFTGGFRELAGLDTPKGYSSNHRRALAGLK
jgi:hypothetical protein